MAVRLVSFLLVVTGLFHHTGADGNSSDCAASHLDDCPQQHMTRTHECLSGKFFIYYNCASGIKRCSRPCKDHPTRPSTCETTDFSRCSRNVGKCEEDCGVRVMPVRYKCPGVCGTIRCPEFCCCRKCSGNGNNGNGNIGNGNSGSRPRYFPPYKTCRQRRGPFNDLGCPDGCVSGMVSRANAPCSCFYFGSNAYWHTAENRCSSFDGHLIEVTDGTRKSIIEELASKQNVTVWVGARRRGNPTLRRVYWQQANALVTAAIYRTNLSVYAAERCVALQSGTLTSRKCNQKFHYICETKSQ